MHLIYYIKVVIFRLTPKCIIRFVEKKRVFGDSIMLDYSRILEYGFAYNNNQECLLAKLRMLTHFLEKGLTMPVIRPCFGIIRLKEIYAVVSKIGSDNNNIHEMQYINGLIDEYMEYHSSRNIELPEENSELIRKIKSVVGSNNRYVKIKQRHYSNSDYFNVHDGDFTQIAFSRHSGRNYINKPIPDNVFIEVAKVANTAPSACNRQPCRMIVVSKKELINQVFALGVGCSGFGHLAPHAIIVTSDISCRNDIYERHQVGVDAGFYGMNVLYALHEKGIGACVLNWDNRKDQNNKIREIIPEIKKSETILFIISCGFMPNEFDIPLGLKRPIEKTICFIK